MAPPTARVLRGVTRGRPHRTQGRKDSSVGQSLAAAVRPRPGRVPSPIAVLLGSRPLIWAGMWDKRRPGPGLHTRELRESVGQVPASPTAGRRWTHARGPVIRGTPRRPSRPRCTQKGPRNHLKPGRFPRWHVAPRQLVVPTCPGKPRSGRPPIGSLKGGTCLRPFLIGSLGEPGSLRVGARQQKGWGFLKGRGLCLQPAEPAGNFKESGAECGLLSPGFRSHLCPLAPVHPAPWVGTWASMSFVPPKVE